jgi:hypothetical protein
MKAVNSLKLTPHDSTDLDRLSYTSGDLVFDITLGTVRLMDGSTLGGSKLATQSWSSTNFATISSLTNYVTNTGLTTRLNNYVTTTAQTTVLNSYVTSDNLTTTLSSYATNTALNSYVTSTSLTTTLNSYVTSTSLTTTLNSYVTSTAQTTALSSYATNTNLALKANLANPTFSGTITSPKAVIGGVNIKAFAIAMGAGLA